MGLCLVCKKKSIWKKFILITISEDMVGHKLGEFSPTRHFTSHTPADKKAKQEAEQRDKKKQPQPK